MSIIDIAIDAQFDLHTKSVQRLESLREIARMAEAGAARFGGNAHIYGDGGAFWPYSIQWQVTVADFRDAVPLIEFIEGWTPAGLECTETKDWPDLYIAQREFCFGPNFSICCPLRSDSVACRAVIKGYKEPEPIYEFECAEDVV